MKTRSWENISCCTRNAWFVNVCLNCTNFHMANVDKFSKEELKRRLDDGELDLSLCSIVKVPVKQISTLQKVTVLDLSCNRISDLQDSFCSLINLVQLDLSKNSLVSLPENFGNLKNLKRLDLYSNNLINLPLSFGDLRLLKWLDLKDNPIQGDLIEIVGNCLDQKECEGCARRMLNFMLELKTREERRKAAEREKERHVKVEEELESLRLQELKRKEKKEEKERRRKLYLAEKEKKEAMNKSGKTSNQNESEISNGKEDDNLVSKSSTSHLYSVYWTTLFMVLVGVVGVVLFYCKDDIYLMLSKLQR